MLIQEHLQAWGRVSGTLPLCGGCKAFTSWLFSSSDPMPASLSRLWDHSCSVAFTLEQPLECCCVVFNSHHIPPQRRLHSSCNEAMPCL